MESYQFRDLIITLEKEGAREFQKVSFPIRYGRYGEIKTPDHLFQFNLNGEIKFIQGRHKNWPHPSEWLKRSVGDDWLYYSAGDYKDIFDLIGEYYYPYFSYPSNSLVEGDPFAEDAVKSAIKSWFLLRSKINEFIPGTRSRALRDFIFRVTENDERALRLRSEKLHKLLRAQITVLPPDARHVDYEIIPLLVADGCRHHCGFCRIKSGQDFVPRSRENVLEQIGNLKWFYDRDLRNYNAIFLGQHDALWAGRDLLEFTAQKAYEGFEFEHSCLKKPRLFLFSSAHSLIHAEERLFESLDSLPFFTFINIGLESADPATLKALKKPVASEAVHEAFVRILDVNRRYEKIEVTANFVLGENLPASHLSSILELVRNRLSPCHSKGAIYLSPLVDERGISRRKRRELLKKFREIKTESPLPTFLYLIQRL